MLTNVRGTGLTRVAIPTNGEIIYLPKNPSGMFGNIGIGDEFVHSLTGDIWGSIFETPEDGYAKNITAYLRASYKNSRVRCALYYESDKPPAYVGLKYLWHVMATEEKVILSGFEGWVTFNFTAPPLITKGVKYWIAGWADEYGSIQISTKNTPGVYQSAEWTSYLAGEPHGLTYPRFYHIVPQSTRKGCLCSIYCTYDFETPTSYKCPYCGTQFPSYEQVLEHIKSTPTEMIYLQICDRCGHTYNLKEELQLHMYEYHGIGSPPTYYSCIFCSFTAATSEEVYTHIDSTHQPEYEEGG